VQRIGLGHQYVRLYAWQCVQASGTDFRVFVIQQEDQITDYLLFSSSTATAHQKKKPKDENISDEVTEHHKRPRKRKAEEASIVYDREASLREADPDSTELHRKEKGKRIKSFSDYAAERVNVKETEARTVFVGNVALGVKKKTLMKHFKCCGKIETIRLRSVPVADLKLPKKASVIMKNFHSSRSSANAYIVFETKAAAVRALLLNGTELRGLHIRVDSAKASKVHNHKHSVFIGNLPFDTEDENLRQHFEVCGEVTSVRIIRDKVTNAGKGFGYVTFEEAPSVGLALSLNNQMFNGRPLRVERSTGKAKPAPNMSKAGRRLSKTPEKAGIDSPKKKTKPRKRDLQNEEDSHAKKHKDGSKPLAAKKPRIEQRNFQHEDSLAKKSKEGNKSPAKKPRTEQSSIVSTPGNKQPLDHKKMREKMRKKLRRRALAQKKASLGQFLTKSR